MKLAVIGLGRLGLPLAATLANYSGHEVMGWDIDQNRLADLHMGRFVTWEPDCDYSQVKFMPALQPTVEQADMVFLCVNTPSNPDGTMDLSQAYQAVGQIASYAQERRNILPVVVNSTVLPGTCRELNNFGGATHIQVISNPVWIAMGSVVKDLRNPPSIVIGCDFDHQHHVGTSEVCPCVELADIWDSTLTMNGLLRGVILPEPHFTDTCTAEFMKLAHNAWCTTKMSWLGELGDRSRELDIDINALSRFMANGGERPGKFWQYGPSFGGPCFPRDLNFWIQVTNDPIGRQAQRVNESRLNKVADRIYIRIVETCGTKSVPHVVILGRSYKYGVNVDEGSIGIELGNILKRRRGCHVDVVNASDDIPQNADIYVVVHKELSGLIPEGKEVINVWEAH